MNFKIVRFIPHTIQKNKHQMDQRCKHKTETRRKHW